MTARHSRRVFQTLPLLALLATLWGLAALPVLADNNASSTLTVENESDQALRFKVVHIESGDVAKNKKVEPGKDRKFTFNFKDCHKERTKHRRIDVFVESTGKRVAKIEVYATVKPGGNSGCGRDYVFRAKEVFDTDYKVSTRIGSSMKNGWLTVK